MRPVRILVPALIFAVSCGGAPEQQKRDEKQVSIQEKSPAPQAGSYEAEIRKFQRDREAALRADNGWLTIAGLFFLTQPRTTFGADPANDIVLPAGAPPRAGSFELRGGRVTVSAAPGVTGTNN